MRYSKIAAIASLILAASAGSANAAVYNWTFVDNGGVTVASGTLTTGTAVSAAGQTVFPVVSGSGNLFAVDGFSAQALSLFGAFTAPTGYAQVGNTTYDNALFQGFPQIDGNGLEFTGASDQVNYNIYNDVNTGNYSAGNYPNHDIFWDGGSQQATGTFTAVAAAVPEPATWGMLILGFGIVGFAMRKRSSGRTTVRYA